VQRLATLDAEKCESFSISSSGIHAVDIVDAVDTPERGIENCRLSIRRPARRFLGKGVVSGPTEKCESFSISSSGIHAVDIVDVVDTVDAVDTVERGIENCRLPIVD
jgi:hypothetical protein